MPLDGFFCVINISMNSIKGMKKMSLSMKLVSRAYTTTDAAVATGYRKHSTNEVYMN